MKNTTLAQHFCSGVSYGLRSRLAGVSSSAENLEDNVMSLGAKLNELRMRKGESLQQTADIVGVTKTHIWELEKGKSSNPSADLLRKLADHFKVTVDYLIDPSRDGLTANDEAMVFYRDLKSLDPRDQETLKQMMEVLKGKK